MAFWDHKKVFDMVHQYPNGELVSWQAGKNNTKTQESRYWLQIVQ